MPSAPPPRSVAPQRGTCRAIFAVTGVVDEVNDLITPGAFTATLAARPVKSVWHHEWKEPVGVVLDVAEWLPGDARFAEIPDWPAEAGALVATVAFNLRTSKGRDTYEQVKQWHEHGQAQFSIGYRVPQSGATRRSDGVRIINTLDLFEVSPVLHGAHPMTRSLEVKAATGPAGTLEYKATRSTVELDVTQVPDGPESGHDDGVKVAGLVVKAADTGRVLMIQRALDDEDPAAGTWEFPGGHIEDGEDPLAAALREWHEETGSTLPGTASVIGAWTAPNGIYRGYVAVVPSEGSFRINVPHGDRRVGNPDDPKGDATEVTAWWPIASLPDLPVLRPECRDTPWSLLAGADLPKAPTAESAPEQSAAARKFAAGVMSSFRSLEGGEAKSARAAVAAARTHGVSRIEHKSARAMVAEAKSRIALEAPMKSAQHLPESQEQFRSRLSDSVRELLDKDEGTFTCIEGTYPDRVIVSVHQEMPGGSGTTTYAIPYQETNGEITLETPEPVELATIVVPEGSTAHRAATSGEDVDARVVQPTVDALTDATARVAATTADPEELEEIRATVRSLVAALSSKGLDVGPPAAEDEDEEIAPPAGMDLWDDDTFTDGADTETPTAVSAPDDAEPEAEPDEEMVHLDAEEVKAALAAMRA